MLFTRLEVQLSPTIRPAGTFTAITMFLVPLVALGRLVTKENNFNFRQC